MNVQGFEKSSFSKRKVCPGNLLTPVTYQAFSNKMLKTEFFRYLQATNKRIRIRTHLLIVVAPQSVKQCPKESWPPLLKLFLEIKQVTVQVQREKLKATSESGNSVQLNDLIWQGN